MSGYTQTDTELTFTGLTTKATTKHKRTNSDAELTIIDNYTYDNQLRLTKHTQKTGSQAEQLITENVYDELGVLVTKNVGGLETAAEPLQMVDYKYNVRGWLTDINSNYEAGIIDLTFPNTLFNFKINYNQIFEGDDDTQPQYNGNISSVAWRTVTDNQVRGYAYDYDHLNRLNYASHLKFIPSMQQAPPFELGGINGYKLVINYDRTGQYAEDLIYDKNGNIRAMERFGQEVAGQPIQIDQLRYTYDGNRLLKVTDGTNNPDGFKDGTNTGNDFTYDTMGNLMTDQNKGIERIKYNHLNLPVEVAIAGGTIKYTYDAAGKRVSKKVESSADGTVITDYLGGFQYEDSDLQFFFQPEGYVKKENNSYLYVFQYKDHLGNVRLSYADIDGNGEISPASEILEENNYYPFGLKHQGYNEIANSNRSEQAEKYQYNGMEWNDALGLNIYEMDLRQYDPAVGRWVVQDPVIHHEFSPYSAFDNNPVYWADPSGADAVPVTVMDLFNATGNGSNATFEFSNGRMISANTSAELEAFLSEVLQGALEMQPLGDVEHEISKGNGHGDGGGNGGGNGNGGGKKRERYTPTFGEIYSVIANNSNYPMGVGLNLFNLNMSLLTGKDRHIFGPDALVITKDVTGGAGIGGTIGWGIIAFMRGEHKGKVYLLGDYGVGISTVDISTGVTAQALYYSGSLSDLNPAEIQGERWSGSFGIQEFAYGGFNVSYSLSNMGFNVYGIGGSLGVGSPSPTGFSFNINLGNTVIINNK